MTAGGPGGGDGSAADPGLHDVPTAVELLEAVREFLEGDVMSATEGRVRFHTRVAVKVLAMLEREAVLGPAQAEAHAARLQALGYTSERELAAAIRRGDLDTRWDEVKRSVWETVADKLAVANPTYADEAEEN